MIAVDTSALMAVVLDETQASACIGALESDIEVIMSAGTFAEALIVATRRGVDAELSAVVDGLGVTIVPVTPGSARRVGDIYRRWGKGFHPAGLNFGDCFGYEAAESHGCPLLYVGDDFSKTDVRSAL